MRPKVMKLMKMKKMKKKNDEDANPVGVNNDDNENDNMEEYDENLFDYEVAQTTQKTRSGRVTRAPDRLNFIQHHIFTSGHKETQYSLVTAQVIAKTMDYLNNLVLSTKKDGKYSFVVTYSLKKGLKKYGKKGYDAAFGEMKQLHDRIAFRPVNVNDLTPQERQRALESIIFLVEKRDGKVKGRTCANGSTQRG